MAAHEFKQSTDGDPRCAQCGCKGHCPKCNEGADGYGHWTKDDDGDFYTCQEFERYQRKLALWKFTFEQKERQELARLKAKYE